MRIRAAIFLVVSLAVSGTPLYADSQTETSHLAFVTEYIRELAAFEHIRESGEREFKENPKDPYSTTIHTSTLFELELNADVHMLRAMSLNAPFDKVIPTITGFYERKIELWQRLIEISSDFIGGPKPNVDYSKLAAELPQVRARMDYIDDTLFQGTALVCSTLLDLRPDSKQHVSHLVITKAERAMLIDTIKTDFGTKLDEKDPNSTVGEAKVIKTFLLSGHKASDEPWD